MMPRLLPKPVQTEAASCYCCVEACSNYKVPLPYKQLTRLPHNEEHLHIFCQVLGLDASVAKNPNAMVCSKHFKSKQAKTNNTPTDLIQMVSTFSLATGYGPPSFPSSDTSVNTPAPEDPPSSGSDTSSSSEAAENMEPVTLDLECDEETLSTAQLSAYMKELMAYCSANEIVYRIQSSGLVEKTTNPTAVTLPSNLRPTESSPLPQLNPFKAPTPVPNLLTTSPTIQPMSAFIPATTGASVVSTFLPATTIAPAIGSFLPATTVSTIGSYVTTGSNSVLGSFLPVTTVGSSSIGSYITTGSVPAIVSSASSASAITTVATAGTWLISSPTVSTSSLVGQPVIPVGKTVDPMTGKLVVQQPRWPPSPGPARFQSLCNAEVIPPPPQTHFPEEEKRNLGERTYSSRLGTRFPYPNSTTQPQGSPPTVSAGPAIATLRFSGPPLTNTLPNISQSTMAPQVVGAVSVNSLGVTPLGNPPPYKEITNSAISEKEPDVQSYLEVQIAEKDDFQMPNRTDVTSIEQQATMVSILNPPRGAEYHPPAGRPLSGTLFSLQCPVPVLRGGVSTVSREEEYLKVRLTPPKNRLHEADQLRKSLQAEHYITSSGHWLLANKVLLPHTACAQCGCKIFLLARDDAQADGFAVTCARQRCQHSTPIRRPGFLELFPRSRLETLLLLSYHWACLSPFEEMKQDLEEVEPSEVSCFYRATRRLCRHKLIGEKIGGKGTVVEMAVFKVGDFFVCCAFERWRSVVCLETYTEAEAYSPTFVLDFVTRFIKAETPLVTQLGSPIPPNLVTVTVARSTVTDPRSPVPHTLNAHGFLKRHLEALFGRFRAPDHRDFLQELMDELSWRSRFGTTVQEAFKNLFLHIKQLDKAEGKAQGDGSVVHKSTKAFNTFYGKMSPKLKLRWSDKSDESTSNNNTQLTKTKAQIGLLPKTNGIRKPTGVQVQPFRKKPPIVRTTGPPPPPPTPAKSEGYPYWVPAFCSALFLEVPAPVGARFRGKKLRLTRTSLLQCRVPVEAKDPAQYYDEVVKLGVRLRMQGFIATPLEWLVEQKYIPGVSTCAKCHQVALLKDTAQGEGEWQCTHHQCRHCDPFRRPAILRKTPLDSAPLPQVAASAYHWCVQSGGRLVEADAPALAPQRLADARGVFQGVATDALRRRERQFEGEVEVALVHRGPVLVLGALERSSRQVRAQCLGYKRTNEHTLYTFIKLWIKPRATIVAAVTKKFNPGEKFNIIVSSGAVKRLSITQWLLRHLESIFGHLEPSEMTTSLVQPYLDEAVWRQRFANSPQEGFDNLMAHLFEEKTGKKYSMEARKEDKSLCVQSPNGAILKDARVVLKRLSKKVLRRYKCSNYLGNLDDDNSSAESSEDDDTVGEKPLSTTNSSSSSSSSSSDEDELDDDDEVSDDSEEDRPLQKLVICKGKTTTTKYFIKDNSSDEGSRHSSRVDSAAAIEDCVTRPLSADDATSSRWVEGLATRELRRKTESYCAECGDVVTSRMDHFMKQFSCSDCRYSTCCQSAFFLHRGSVLFGRRTTAVRAPYGLHKPRQPLQRPLRCSRCALTSTHPKIMMSHLLRCGRGTCTVNT